MEYLELTCFISEHFNKYSEIIIAELAEIGFESFVENEPNELLAYIPYDNWDIELLNNKNLYPDNINIEYNWQIIEDKNWNEEWEKNYNPVKINERCYIRAPFHEPLQNIEYEIIIEPKMSFGTAHHETTSLMLEYELELNFTDKKILDMGSGTAVLSILAEKRGANYIWAIDNDEWAYNNALENIKSNNSSKIKAFLSDVKQINNEFFDIILANINRNILLNDIKFYAKSLNKNGNLILSGFYIDDLLQIEKEANQHNLMLVNYKTKNNWVAALFILK